MPQGDNSSLNNEPADKDESSQSPSNARAITRYCRYCGREFTGTSPSEFTQKRECPTCGKTAILLTRKAYDKHLVRQAEIAAFDEKQKSRAAEIHASLDTLPPVLPQDCNPYYYHQALILGLGIPLGATYEQVRDSVICAEAEGIKPNYQIDSQRCAEELGRRWPASNEQLNALNKLHASFAKPLTHDMAYQIIDRLFKDVDIDDYGYDEEIDYEEFDKLEHPLFKCPFCHKRVPAFEINCEFCEENLDDWVLEVSVNRAGDMKVKSKVDVPRQLVPITKPAPVTKLACGTEKWMPDAEAKFFPPTGGTGGRKPDVEAEPVASVPISVGGTQTSSAKEPKDKHTVMGCGCLIIIAIAFYWLIGSLF